MIAGSWFVHRVFGRRSVTIPLTVLGIGALGVGLFPGNTGAPHSIFAMVTSSPAASPRSARPSHTAPFRFFSFILGAVSLRTLNFVLLLGRGSPMTALGIGGVERWIVYPVILWVIAFGGYLSGRADGDEPRGRHEGHQMRSVESTQPLSRVATAALRSSSSEHRRVGRRPVLMIAPRGEIMPLPCGRLPARRSRPTWAGTDPVSVLGLGPLFAAGLAWGRHRSRLRLRSLWEWRC